MSVRLPRLLVVTLLAIGTLLLALSTYLEERHLELLLRHPVYANLLSGAIGFCFGAVALSAVLGRMLVKLQDGDTKRRYLAYRQQVAQSLSESAAYLERFRNGTKLLKRFVEASRSLSTDLKLRDASPTFQFRQLPRWLDLVEEGAKLREGSAKQYLSESIARCRVSLAATAGGFSWDGSLEVLINIDKLLAALEIFDFGLKESDVQRT